MLEKVKFPKKNKVLEEVCFDAFGNLVKNFLSKI